MKYWMSTIVFVSLSVQFTPSNQNHGHAQQGNTSSVTSCQDRKPAHEAVSASLTGRILLCEASRPPREASFSLCIVINLQKKEPKSSSATMMFMNFHKSTLHVPIYRSGQFHSKGTFSGMSDYFMFPMYNTPSYNAVF